MIYGVRVLPDVSLDPLFKVEFSYKDEHVEILNAHVEILRKPPKIKFTYDSEVLEKLDLVDKHKLELELLNKVIEYIMRNCNGTTLKIRSFKGTE